MQIQKTSTNFQGIWFPQKVQTGDLDKIKDFLANEKNITFIKRLNTRETDIFFTKGIKEVGFSHQRYGSLEKYGAGNIPTEDFTKNTDKILQNVSNAINKVQQAWRDVLKNS